MRLAGRGLLPLLAAQRAQLRTAVFPQHSEVYQPQIGVQLAAGFMVIEAAPHHASTTLRPPPGCGGGGRTLFFEPLPRDRRRPADAAMCGGSARQRGLVASHPRQRCEPVTRPAQLTPSLAKLEMIAYLRPGGGALRAGLVASSGYLFLFERAKIVGRGKVAWSR